MKRLSLVLALVLFGAGFALAQKTVTGTVTDESGEALIGASILVKGTTSGTVTDLDGKYSLSVPEASSTLIFSYTGFNTQEVEVGAQTVIDLVMSEGVSLGEVVVTALGVEREEKALGYAVQQVESEALSNSGILRERGRPASLYRGGYSTASADSAG